MAGGAGPRLHVGDRVGPGSCGRDDGGHVGEPRVARRRRGVGVEHVRRDGPVRRGGRRETDRCASARVGRPHTVITGRRVRTPVEPRVEDRRAGRQRERRPAGVERRCVGVDVGVIHREAVVVDREPRLRVTTRGRRRATAEKRVRRGEDLPSVRRLEARRVRPIGGRGGRREQERGESEQHQRDAVSRCACAQRGTCQRDGQPGVPTVGNGCDGRPATARVAVAGDRTLLLRTTTSPVDRRSNRSGGQSFHIRLRRLANGSFRECSVGPTGSHPARVRDGRWRDGRWRDAVPSGERFRHPAVALRPPGAPSARRSPRAARSPGADRPTDAPGSL